MTDDQIFIAWAPTESIWSNWAKPVLFAHLHSILAGDTVMGEADVAWAPPLADRVAMILDLPGDAGVQVGLALARRGYRPVPLYNAVPLPASVSPIDPGSGRSVAAVDVVPIIGALRSAAPLLASLPVAPDASPTFILDANRAGGGRIMEPEEFDNRSISFATDFPSANFLLAHHIRRALLVQHSVLRPQQDLAHTLRRWQDSGIAISRLRLDPLSSPEEFEVPTPPWFSVMFQRAIAAMGFRRARSGGFGNWVPDTPAGG